MATEVFEFIDCATLSISYATTGLATVSFTVVSTNQIVGLTPVIRDYTQLTFGGIDYAGFVTSLESQVIPASIPPVFEHRFSLIMTGCGINCPRELTSLNT